MTLHKLWTTVAAASTLVLAFAGCQREDRAAQAGAADAPKAAAVDPVFAQTQQAWRDARRARLASPDGWTSLIGLHWIDPGPHYFGTAATNGIRLAMGPAHFGMIERKGDAIVLTPDRSAALTLDGEPLLRPTRLKSDADETGASVLGFDEGKGIATVLKRGDRYALRVKHADAETRARFAGIDYWPADAGWRLDGKFVPHPAGKTIPIANIIGTIDAMPNPGKVEFEHGGRTWSLEALDEGEGLFLIFADRTSGHESYGAGRYIDAADPDAGGRVVIDFNQAYNPPCAFTPFATCPLPPPENRLDLAVNAGEKAYKQAH
jgi:uncharacterized protein (DUF1684 family)